MKVCVTGSMGWIASYVVPLLESRGHIVIPWGHASKPWHDADVCLQLAWSGRSGGGSEHENIRSLQHSLEVLDQVLTFHTPRFIGIGSCFEYATDTTPRTESDPLAATGPNPMYSHCKLSLAAVSRMACQSAGITWTWARIFNCYGEGEPRYKLVPQILRGLRGESIPMSPGEQVRDYLHVGDVAAALVKLVESDMTGPVNICSGRGLTVRQLAQYLADQCGGSTETLHWGALPYRQNDPMYLVGDPTKLHSIVSR